VENKDTKNAPKYSVIVSRDYLWDRSGTAPRTRSSAIAEGPRDALCVSWNLA